MIEYSRDIDIDKYKTFFLSYYKDANDYTLHIVRPCTATYEEVSDISKNRVYTLEGCVLTFKHDTSIAEILIECAVRGISIDFIDLMVEDKDADKWSSSKEKCVQVIDTHKEDVSKYLEEYEAKRYYVAKTHSKKRVDNLKYLVVDRFSQDSKVKFLNGVYENEGVVAGFKKIDEAEMFCKKMNEGK